MAGSIALACANAGAAVAWVVPTYRNARAVWKFAERMTFPVSDRLTISKADREIGFPGGGNLSVYSADNIDSILGNAFHLAILDEAARIAEDAWTSAVQPTLADYDGRAILISTPKGKNWFWEEFEKAQHTRGEAAAFTAPTNANPSPNIRKAFELARSRVPERVFRQEWLAQFLGDGGEVFRFVRQAVKPLPTAYDPTHTYVLGLDWGRFNDETVAVVVDVNLRAVVCVDAFTDVEFLIQRRRISELARRYNAVIIAETNSIGLPNVEALRSSGLTVYGVETSNATKAAQVDALVTAFEAHSIAIPSNERLITQLEAFEGKRLPSGLTRYAAPGQLHDDHVMALMLAWSAVDTGWQEQSEIVVYEEPVSISPY